MTKQTVLIADDDLTILKLLQATLSPYYEVITAHDGAEALEKALTEQPDCLVLDVMMPELNGWEVAKSVRSHPEFDHVGILMVTAIGETLNEITSELYGADDHVNKPFDIQEVLTKVEEILSRKLDESF